MGQFVTDLDVLIAYDAPAKTPFHPPAGWEWIDLDLNTGARGAYLYFVFERCPHDPPITGIRILQDDEDPPTGYQKLPIDLNKGTLKHDKALFLAVTRAAGRPIADLTVTRWSGGPRIPPPNGYSRIETDLNLGAGGDYIYLDYLPAAETTPGASIAAPVRESA
jgi:hypothetical protein